MQRLSPSLLLAAICTLAACSGAVRPTSIRVDSAGLLTFSVDSAGTVYKIG